MDYEKLKPFLKQFIKYYYDDLGNAGGGSLHIALDDGNLSEGDLFFCQQQAEMNGDSFGYFLATLMRNFTESELEEMYESDFWGMEKREI